MWEKVPSVRLQRCNQRHLYPNSNGHADNGEISYKKWELLNIYIYTYLKKTRNL
jgi:hypothetical protein